MRIKKLLTSIAAIFALTTSSLVMLDVPQSASATTIANLPARWSSITSPGTGETCAIATNGTLWCWGLAESPRGVVWDPSKGDPASGTAVGPTQVGTAKNWTKVQLTSGHACAENTAQEIWCWGSNAQGQLGIGTTVSSQTPVLVKAYGKKWSDFDVTLNWTCAISGTALWCWGNAFALPTLQTVGQASITSTSEIQMGVITVIKTGGHLWIWTPTGNSWFEVSAPLYQTWSSFQVSSVENAGYWDGSFLNRAFSMCAISSGGSARCYNWVDFGQYADLGGYTDWVSLAAMGSTPRQPICGVRGGQAKTITCFSAYGILNTRYTNGCKQAKEVQYYGFTNGLVEQAYSYGGYGACPLTYWGTIPLAYSIDMPTPGDSTLSSLDGGWFSGSVANEYNYFVWGRLMALTSDGRIFAMGDGKYGERQDGIANGTVTESFSSSLTQSPTVTSLNRSKIPKTGGASVTISGSFLVGVTDVSVGGVTVSHWTESPDGTTLTFTSPASATGGTVGVTVVTAGGNASLNSVLTYGDSPSAPAVTGIQPTDGGAVINWSAPTSAGSSSVTSYTVTATPGGQTCVWTAGPLSCTLIGLSNGSSYRVSVVASSDVGPGTASSLSATFTPYKVAGAPVITDVQANSTSVTVTWSAPANNGSAITRYDAEAQPGGASCNTDGTGNTCTITGLTNGTSYTIDVYATNDAGSSDTGVWPSAVIPRTIPGAPTAVAINPGDKQLTVSWRAPSSNGGYPVQSYIAVANPGGATCSAVAPSTTCNILGLSNGSVYSITVVATNPAGNSEASVATTSSPVTIPGKPSISAVESGANNMLIRWRAPSTTGGASVTSYTVTATPGGGTCTVPGTTFYCVISGLDNGVTYAFTVTATNSAGVGSASASYNGVPAAAPGVPRNVQAVASNSGITVTWAAPSYDGGTAVTGYIATIRSTGDVCQVGASVTTCAFTPANGVTLANGTSYIVDVAALNNAGKSDTTASNSVTPRTTATKPTLVSLLPGAGTIRVSWAAPVSDGGASVTSYVVIASPGSFTCTSAGTYCDLVGLTAATSYSVQVYANNAAGAGEKSAAISAIPYTTPGAPNSLSAVADDQQINVSWAAPTSDGGSGITGYTVTLSPGGGTCTAPANTFSCSVKGLTNGTLYTVKITANNAAGAGAEAALATKVTPRGAPTAPTIKSVDSGNQSLIVKWTALSGASLNGASISKYIATASPSGQSCSVDGSINGIANTTCTISGLLNGVSQSVTVVAVNEGGTSPASLAVVRAARSAPSAPTAVTVNPLDGSLSIGWAAPVDNGGLLITGFTVTATPVGVTAAGSTCVQQSGDSRSCVITNLSNGTQYSVSITATNDAGTSTGSTPVLGTPAAVPSAPTKVIPTVSAGQIAVKWTASNDNGSPILAYHVVVQPGNNGCDVTDLSYLGCTVTGLDNGVPYSISVYATNGAGDSSKGSITGTVTPRAIPQAPAVVSVSAASGQATISWVPGFDGGSAIKSYLVVAQPGGAQCTASGTASQCTIQNLVNGSKYTFSVTASNDAGSSNPTLSSQTLIAGTPNAPQGLKVKPGDQSLVISFAPPALDGGNAVVNYLVYVNDEVACTVIPAKVLTCTVNDLENGTPQIVRVTAINQVGTSVSTAEVTGTPGRIPDAVTDVQASASAGGLTVSWTEPFDDGGSPITGYTVTLTPGGKVCKADAATTSCDFTGLAVGTSYVAKVVAVNGVGISAAATSSAVKVVGPPTVVRSVSATALAKSAKIYFAAPSNNGGSSIISYLFTITGPDGVASAPIEVLASSVKGSYVVTGLTKNVTYTITVYATNEFGVSTGVAVKVKSK